MIFGPSRAAHLVSASIVTQSMKIINSSIPSESLAAVPRYLPGFLPSFAAFLASKLLATASRRCEMNQQFERHEGSPRFLGARTFVTVSRLLPVFVCIPGNEIMRSIPSRELPNSNQDFFPWTVQVQSRKFRFQRKRANIDSMYILIIKILRFSNNLAEIRVDTVMSAI